MVISGPALLLKPSLVLMLVVLCTAQLGIAQQAHDRSEPDPEKLLITVTQAHALCLIATETLPAEQALAIAHRFLIDEGLSLNDQRTIQEAPDFQAQLENYIQSQGGCRTLIQPLMP